MAFTPSMRAVACAVITIASLMHAVVGTAVGTDGVSAFTSCEDARDSGETASGVQTLTPLGGGVSFQAYCNQDDNGGGWMLAGQRGG